MEGLLLRFAYLKAEVLAGSAVTSQIDHDFLWGSSVLVNAELELNFALLCLSLMQPSQKHLQNFRPNKVLSTLLKFRHSAALQVKIHNLSNFVLQPHCPAGFPCFMLQQFTAGHIYLFTPQRTVMPSGCLHQKGERESSVP